MQSSFLKVGTHILSPCLFISFSAPYKVKGERVGWFGFRVFVILPQTEADRPT